MHERGVSRAPPPARKRGEPERGVSRPPPSPSSGQGPSQVRPDPSTIRLRSADLPFLRDVKPDEPALSLEIDSINLLVEFPRRSAGRLFISRKDPAVVGHGDIDVDRIPVRDGMKLKNNNNGGGGGGGGLGRLKSSLFAFQLRHKKLTRLNIGFHWGSI